MTTYTATFSNGQSETIKNSKRAYAAAWMVTVQTEGGVSTSIGFSRDETTAAKAARAHGNMVCNCDFDRISRKWIKSPKRNVLKVEVVAL